MEDQEELSDETLTDIIVELLKTNPEAIVWYTATIFVLVTIFVTASVLGISRAGRYNPPSVVITLVVGIIVMLSLLAATLVGQDVQNMFVVISAAGLGAIAATLGGAYAERRFLIAEQEFIDERRKQSTESEDDGPDVRSGAGIIAGPGSDGLDGFIRGVRSDPDVADAGESGDSSDGSGGVVREGPEEEHHQRES